MQTFEFIIYFFVFTTAQIYSLFQFYYATQNSSIIGYILQQQQWLHNGVGINDFEVVNNNNNNKNKSWTLSLLLPWTCNQPHDISDLEWQIAKQYYIGWKIFLLIGHCLGFKVMRHFCPQVFIYLFCFLFLFFFYLLF